MLAEQFYAWLQDEDAQVMEKGIWGFLVDEKWTVV